MAVKRFLTCMLVAVLLLTGLAAYGEMEPVNAVITIDGVRTAFFTDGGEYLPPLSENGVLYVPVIPLAESLQIDVTANPETLAVTMNGVRMAFFAKDSSLLMPKLANGQVYVPLAAFAESAGLALSEEDGHYAFVRAGQLSAQAATTQPTAAPTPFELYGYVPLGMDNYSRYYSLSQDYYAPSGYPSPYTIRFTATVTATTGYSPVNVSFSLRNYGSFTMPASGRATVSYQSESLYSYQSKTDKDYIIKVASLQTSAFLKLLILRP